MTCSTAAPKPGWRYSALVRILGSGGAWFLFSALAVVLGYFTALAWFGSVN